MGKKVNNLFQAFSMNMMCFQGADKFKSFVGAEYSSSYIQTYGGGIGPLISLRIMQYVFEKCVETPF